MRRTYKILFRVKLSHGYYTEGISPDFFIIPTPETTNWLKNNNMLFRTDNTGFRVFYTADTGSEFNFPFTSFEATKLRFMLLLKNPGKFFNVTNLVIGGKTYQSGNILEFVNTGTGSQELNKHLIWKTEPSIFTYEFPQKAESPLDDIGKLEIFNEQNEQIILKGPDPNEIIPTNDGRFLYPVDLTEYPIGVYRFKTYVNNTDEEERSIYVDGRLKKTGVFGMVHIDLSSSSVLFDPEEEELQYTAPDYDAALLAKAPYWRYLMIMKNEPVGEKTFGVRDTRSEYTFIQKTDTEINGFQTLVYDSEERIPLSEQPINTFCFVDVSDEPPPSEIKILKSLSNPVVNIITDAGPNHPEITQIYVYV